MIFVGFSNIMVRSLQILARWRISRRDLEFHKRHGEISTISARSLQSRRVLGNLGEMEHISPRSRQDLESNKNHGEISARSLQSRRDLINLDEISPISARSRQFRRDLGKNFARVTCTMLKIAYPGLEISKFSGGAWPQTPLVARTFRTHF